MTATAIPPGGTPLLLSDLLGSAVCVGCEAPNDEVGVVIELEASAVVLGARSDVVLGSVDVVVDSVDELSSELVGRPSLLSSVEVASASSADDVVDATAGGNSVLTDEDALAFFDEVVLVVESSVIPNILFA